MSKKKIIVSGLACALALSVAAVSLAVVGHDKRTRNEFLSMFDENQEKVTAALDYCDGLLTAEKRSARVYDNSGTFLFDLNLSGDLDAVSELPDNFVSGFTSEILNGVPVTPIDTDSWAESKTYIGGLFKDSTDAEFYVGSLGYKLAMLYADYTGVELSKEETWAVGAAFESKYDSDSLVSLLAILGEFGPYRGAQTASLALFDKELKDLNTYQIQYIVYSYGNEDSSWSDFVEAQPDSTGGATTELEFGFSNTNGNSYWFLQQKLREELENIGESVELPESYSIQIAIDTSLQKEMQNQLDTGLKSSIELSTNGQTVLDGVLCVIDSHTGFVTALVGGRSANDLEKEFYLDSVSFIGNLEEAKKQFEEDSTLTYASLMEYENSAGQTEFAAFADLVYSDQLSLIGMAPTVESSIRVDELNNFFTNLFVDNDARYITEIRSTDDNLIYSAVESIDVSADSPNIDLRALLNGSAEGTESVYEQVCERGYVCCIANSEYIFVSILGSNSDGYTVSQTDYDLLMTTALSAKKILPSYYPRELQPLDAKGVVASKLSEAQNSNVEIMTEASQSWVEDLKSMEINSVGTRAQFEEAYNYYLTLASSLKGILTDEYIAQIQEDIESVRTSRTEELLQFVA